jgi:uncharacterized protein HemX
MDSGILSNPQNEAIHRASRSLQRQTKASQKVKESNVLSHLQKDLTFEIAELQESRRQLAAKEKAVREQLKSVKSSSKAAGKSSGSTGRANTRSMVVSASS